MTTTTEYDSTVVDDLKQQVMMLKVQNQELNETIEENRMGMIAYEHLCQVIEKLSILLIRTDRGIYKKKNIDRRNNIIAKSTTLSAFQKNRKSAIVPSINLGYLNQHGNENPTQRGGHPFKTLHDDGPSCFNPRYPDDIDVAQSVCTDMVNIRGQDGGHDNRSQYTSP